MLEEVQFLDAAAAPREEGDKTISSEIPTPITQRRKTTLKATPESPTIKTPQFSFVELAARVDTWGLWRQVSRSACRVTYSHYSRGTVAASCKLRALYPAATKSLSHGRSLRHRGLGFRVTPDAPNGLPKAPHKRTRLSGWMPVDQLG